MDDLLPGLVRRISTLESARSDLASKFDALQSDNVRLNQRVDGLARENAILREEIASLKYGESTPAKSRKRPKAEHLSLTTLRNDTQVHIASFLGAKGIARLSQTCRHFGGGHVGTDGQLSSLSEELAGQVFDGSATDYEKSVLVGGRNVRRLHDLELMRSPLHFEQLIGSADVIRYSQPEDRSTISLKFTRKLQHATAVSNQEMRAGRHYATFHITEVQGYQINKDFGVIRPIKDLDKKGLENFDPICYENDLHKHRKLLLAEKTDEWGDDLHCCSYSSFNGKCCSANWNDEDKGEDDDWNGDDWVGMEPVRIVDGLAVGLLLDLDAGTLSVFKDGRKLGVMKEGLTGAYCWFVYSPISTRGAFCINVKRGMPPENE